MITRTLDDGEPWILSYTLNVSGSCQGLVEHNLMFLGAHAPLQITHKNKGVNQSVIQLLCNVLNPLEKI